jgi:hypothetical protein
MGDGRWMLVDHLNQRMSKTGRRAVRRSIGIFARQVFQTCVSPLVRPKLNRHGTIINPKIPIGCRRPLCCRCCMFYDLDDHCQ